jgi:SAM-dependent methyltransferase
MQTCLILNGMLALTPEMAERAGIGRRADAQITVTDDALVIESGEHDVPAGTAPGRQVGQLDELTMRLSSETLDALGWQSGDVLGIELVDGHLEARKLADPNDPSLTARDDDGIPVPPHWLIQMVAGKTATAGFVASGHKVARLFAGLFERHLPVAEQTRAVLDFGCGCGRVARLMPRYLDCEIFGCDITAPAIEWCGRNLPGEFFPSADEPPLDVPDACYDALYAVSVLTHLDERRQDAWLQEWRRIVRPGGLLLVTYRGDGFLARAEPSKREHMEQIRAGGFGFTPTGYWQGVFPDYYGGAFHTDAYVREHWGRFFEVLEQHSAVDTGLVQDVAVLRSA